MPEDVGVFGRQNPLLTKSDGGTRLNKRMYFIYFFLGFINQCVQLVSRGTINERGSSMKMNSKEQLIL